MISINGDDETAICRCVFFAVKPFIVCFAFYFIYLYCIYFFNTAIHVLVLLVNGIMCFFIFFPFYLLPLQRRCQQGGGAPPPVGNSGSPTRIHKVILQETMGTIVLYTLPAVEPIIRVNDSAIIIVAGKPFHGSTRGRRQQKTHGHQRYGGASSLVLRLRLSTKVTKHSKNKLQTKKQT